MTPDNELMFATAHGSRLYGADELSTEIDTYQIWLRPPRRKERKVAAAQRIEVIGAAQFTKLVAEAQPRALEALFSPMSEIDSTDHALFFSAINTTPEKALATYTEAIMGFARRASPVQRLHALRMCRNLSQLIITSRFDPRLTPEQRELSRAIAHAEIRDWTATLESLLSSAQIGKFPAALERLHHRMCQPN